MIIEGALQKSIALEFGVDLLGIFKTITGLGDKERQLVYSMQLSSEVNILTMREKWMSYLRETFESFSDSLFRFIEFSEMYQDYVDNIHPADQPIIGNASQTQIDIIVRESRAKMEAGLLKLDLLFREGDEQYAEIKKKVAELRRTIKARKPKWGNRCRKKVGEISAIIKSELQKAWFRITRYSQLASLVISGDKDILKKVDGIVNFAIAKYENENKKPLKKKRPPQNA